MARRRRLDMKRLHQAMFILPNLFTVSSIFCGFYAAVTAAAAQGDSKELYRACIAVLFAMIFDSVDGRVARLTRTESEFGVQMDSLADVISFGAAPALIAWHWGLSSFGSAGLFVCFVYAACGAIRLARFNVLAARHSGPSDHFVGLPIPAAAGLLVAVIIAYLQSGGAPLTGDEIWPPALLLVLAGLMVSTVRFRTFKATRMTRRAFALIMLVFGSTALVAVQVRPSIAIVGLMGSYLTFGLIEASIRLIRRLAAATSSTIEAGDEDEDEDEEAAATEVTALGSPVNPRDDEDEELLD